MADVALPWYRSRILQGILTVAVAQLVKHVQSHYNLDLTVWGTAVPDVVNGVMDGASAVALAWAAHARINPKVPIPPIVTGSKGTADKINAMVAPDPKP